LLPALLSGRRRPEDRTAGHRREQERQHGHRDQRPGHVRPAPGRIAVVDRDDHPQSLRERGYPVLGLEPAAPDAPDSSYAPCTSARWSGGQLRDSSSSADQSTEWWAPSTNGAVRSRTAGAPSSTTATAHGRSPDSGGGRSSQDPAGSGPTGSGRRDGRAGRPSGPASGTTGMARA